MDQLKCDVHRQQRPGATNNNHAENAIAVFILFLSCSLDHRLSSSDEHSVADS